ncbi:hypothetical protein LZ480_06550 [Solibacillus sp. MA9]|uniref:Uncharacterized protein n=1 Tax=Solibacillus palustris TaxID=2908203 RepID=A0ABS9UC47_9BACL|nr:hypothetical protein [Solibacillus sp. MA9]MCH7321550.1 hypothetical protein [Solibacillus sp. MA9]
MIASEVEMHPGHWKNKGSDGCYSLTEGTEARKVAKRVYEILRSWKVLTAYFEENTSLNRKLKILNIAPFRYVRRMASYLKLFSDSWLFCTPISI